MSHPMPNRAQYFMDISDNNPTPNLDAYRAAGHEYLAVKISEGTGYYNPEAAAIIDGWHQRGGKILGYHWLRPDSGTPAQQVGFYFSHFGPHFRPGDLTMNDWERSTVYRTGRPANEPPPAEWAADAAQFNDACHATYNAHCLYTGNWYLDEGHPLVVEAQRWPVILSDYTGGDGPPNNRLNLKIWARQFTDRATVPGMSRPVDYNHIINADAIGGAMSATGPEHWDTPDFDHLFNRFAERLHGDFQEWQKTKDKTPTTNVAQSVHQATVAHLFDGDAGNQLQLQTLIEQALRKA